MLEGIATTTFAFPFLGPSSRRAVTRRWCARLLRILNVETRVRGRLPGDDPNVLIVANHISWLDILVLNAAQPMRFVAKAELARWPIAGRLIRDVGTLFVERSRRLDAHRMNRQTEEALASGDVVAVFPEGTTTDGTKLLPFKSSLLQAIVVARGRVQPVAIRYRTPTGMLSLVPAYVDDVSIIESFWCVVNASGLVVELEALPALPADGAHRRELARAAEDAIRAALPRSPDARAPETLSGRPVG